MTQAIQLELFPPVIQKRITKRDFWKLFRKWEANVDESVRVDAVVAFCETLGRKAYCYGMRADIIEINDGKAHVRTTEEWEKACKRANSISEVNAAGNIWIVDIDDLAPII